MKWMVLNDSALVMSYYDKLTEGQDPYGKIQPDHRHVHVVYKTNQQRLNQTSFILLPAEREALTAMLPDFLTLEVL